MLEAIRDGKLPVNPHYESLRDGRIRLLAPWGMQFEGYLIAVPAGFICDGASIPRFFWRVIGHPLQEPIVRAALLHDGGYQGVLWGRLLIYLKDKAPLTPQLCPLWMPGAMNDRMFRELLAKQGLSWWRRVACWLGVRVYYRARGCRRYETLEAWQWNRHKQGVPKFRSSWPVMFDVSSGEDAA